MVRAIFPLDFLVGSFEGFWGISSAAEREFVSEIEGFAGSLKVTGVLRSFIAALLSGEDSKPTEQKAPRIPATFKNSAKNPLDKSRFPAPENGPFEPSWVGRDCSIHPLEKNPNPRNDSSFIHSSPVQEQSNPQNPQKLTENQCFSQKTLDSILEKFQSKLACFSEISAEKKLDSPG
jgi:hypothetical protein